MASSGTSAGTQKVLRKLEASLAAGQFYEAHEMFKTVYYRLRARRQAEESYALCQEGARLQLTRGQLNCGVELCMLLVEAYEADQLPPSDASVGRLLSLLDAYPRGLAGAAAGQQAGDVAAASAAAGGGGGSGSGSGSGGSDPPLQEASKFAAAAVKWLRGSSSADSWRHEAALEGRLAAYATAALGWQGLGWALPHYARSGDAAAMAGAVATAAAAGRPEEEDLFLFRAALTMAAARPPPGAPAAAARQRQLDAARQLLGPAYAAAAGRAARDTPLLHCGALLLEALERRSEELVELLVERYRPALQRDPQLYPLLARARGAHLPPQAAGGGMGGLLGGLFGDLLAQPA